MVTERAYFRRALKIYKMAIFLENSGIKSSLSRPIWLDSLRPINTIFGPQNAIFCSDKICIVQTVGQFPISHLLIGSSVYILELCSACMNLKVSQ